MAYTYEDYKKIYQSKMGSVDEALALIKSGDVIWCSNNYNEPVTLFERLHEIADRVENVIVYKSRIGRYPFLITPGMTATSTPPTTSTAPATAKPTSCATPCSSPWTCPTTTAPSTCIAPATSSPRRSPPWTSMATCTSA